MVPGREGGFWRAVKWDYPALEGAETEEFSVILSYLTTSCGRRGPVSKQKINIFIILNISGDVNGTKQVVSL